MLYKRIPEIELTEKGILERDVYPKWDELDWEVFFKMQYPLRSFGKVAGELDVYWVTVGNRFEKILKNCDIWAILTHNLSRGEIPPEHYQVWTEISWPQPVYENPYQLGKYLRSSKSREILLGELAQPIPPDNPFSENLKDYYSESSTILSLCYVGVALRGGSPVLIAFLRGDAPPGDIVQSIYEVEIIKNNIEHTG